MYHGGYTLGCVHRVYHGGYTSGCTQGGMYIGREGQLCAKRPPFSLGLFPFHCWLVLSLPGFIPVSLLVEVSTSLGLFPFHCWLRVSPPGFIPVSLLVESGKSLCNSTLCGGFVGYSRCFPFHCWASSCSSFPLHCRAVLISRAQ